MKNRWRLLSGAFAVALVAACASGGDAEMPDGEAPPVKTQKDAGPSGADGEDPPDTSEPPEDTGSPVDASDDADDGSGEDSGEMDSSMPPDDAGKKKDSGGMTEACGSNSKYAEEAILALAEKDYCSTGCTAKQCCYTIPLAGEKVCVGK